MIKLNGLAVIFFVISLYLSCLTLLRLLDLSWCIHINRFGNSSLVPIAILFLHHLHSLPFIWIWLHTLLIYLCHIFLFYTCPDLVHFLLFIFQFTQFFLWYAQSAVKFIWVLNLNTGFWTLLILILQSDSSLSLLILSFFFS